MSIPILDLALDDRSLASALGVAFRGFIALANDGVPAPLNDALYAAANDRSVLSDLDKVG
jgi:hypothetical protein